ncbi:MAG: CPBP family intramembrane glutamic endopeptidase [Candidatus Eremiobacteraeota bacterium]|nr:CPBP family intramembrane glutamic endopeptidase [Candidatus Eremiobacteraeota bacterium]
MKKSVKDSISGPSAMLSSMRVLDRGTIAVLLTIPLFLWAIQFFGLTVNFFQFFPSVTRRFSPDVANLLSFVYWSVCCAVGYVGLPLLVISRVLKDKARNFGLPGKPSLSHGWIYCTLYLAVLPFVVFAAFQKSFLSVYPFYLPSAGKWQLFLIFEAFYLLQFFSLEFFFRGYILFSLERTFGVYSIFIMTIPYCMIHFPKPALEALAAILAGIVLGWLALRTRSIWYGVMIHMSVALTMDVLALVRGGYLPRLFLH